MVLRWDVWLDAFFMGPSSSLWCVAFRETVLGVHSLSFPYLKMSQLLSHFWRLVFLGAQTLKHSWKLPSALWPGQAALCEHPFSIAVVMSYQEVRGLKHHDLGLHSARACKSEVPMTGRKSSCWQLPSFLEAWEETCRPPILDPHLPPLMPAVTGWSSSSSILTPSLLPALPQRRALVDSLGHSFHLRAVN